jgi:hypothetical protein
MKNRFHIKYVDVYEKIMNENKKKYNIRFFKKLDGDSPGWSIPNEFRTEIDALLNHNSTDKKLKIFVEKSTQVSEKDFQVEKRRYENDVANEVFQYFKQYIK